MSDFSNHVLGLPASPLPPSFDGSGALFGAALFVLITITSLSIAILRTFIARLWIDRREGKTMAWAHRLTIACVCAAAVIRCAPEVAYMIAYAEAQPATLQLLLTIKRSCDVLAFIPALGWMALVYLYSPEIEFAIKYPTSKMWTDYRLHRLKGFGLIFLCAAGIAMAVTVGRLLH